MTLEDVEQQARNVLLPDDAEESGEVQDWAGIRQVLLGEGFDVTEAELRLLPSDVIVDEALKQMLTKQ